jgi:hypothetical protein
VDKKTSPGAVITSYAFKYACSFYDYAADKFPELKVYSPENSRGASLQAAIIVATLIMQERRLGEAGRAERHAAVMQSFPASVQYRHLMTIQHLAAEILQQSIAGLKPQEIPSFGSVADVPDDKLIKTIGLWLARAVSKKKELTEQELKLAAAMGRSAWNSATMISRMLNK